MEDNTRLIIKEILEDDEFTEGEKQYLKYQYSLNGGFYKAFWDVVWKADENNLARLALGFPSEVAAYISWTRGDLAYRFKRKGLDI